MVCLACTVSAQGIKVSFEPVFQGDSTGPVLVTMQNPGRGVSGRVRVEDYTSKIFYPVELPSGSVKQIIVTNSGGGYGNKLQFESGARIIEAPVSYDYNSIQRRSAVIHDEPDAVVQMNKADPVKKLSAGFYAAKAESVPDRLSGYDSYNSVWLAQGSDRLSDAQVAAIKNYLIHGGSVVFIGGAGNSALRDSRWMDVLRAKGEGLSNQTQVIASGIPNLTFGTVNLPSTAWETTQFNGLGGYKSVGAGRVVILRFSPFDKVFVDAGVASRLAARVVTIIPQRQVNDLFHSTANKQEYEYGFPTGYDSDSISSSAQGVFKYEAPKSGDLFAPVWVFALILAPLSILVPRMMKRAELAWVFAPVSAISVAVLVMSSQSGLRSSAQAQVTSGTIFAQEGIASSVAVLKTELFFPRSGRFDLNMDPPERAELEGGSGGMLSRTSDTFDVGAAIVPPVTVKNLEFRTLYSREIIDGPSTWLEYEVLSGQKKVKVTNKAPFEIKSIRLGMNKEAGPLPAGKSLTIGAELAQKDLDLLICTIEKLPLGPKIGEATSSIVVNYRLKGRVW